MIDVLQPLVPALDLKIVAVYALILLAMVAFFREWSSPDIVALSVLGAIIVLGLLPIRTQVEDGMVVQRGVLSVFSNGAPLTIASMFVLSAAMERTGVIDRVGRFFRRYAGRTEIRVMAILRLVAAVFSAFVNNTPIVVFLLPVVLGHARSTDLRASRLLIPLSYAAILGGTCTLTGTSTNLIVDGVAQEHGVEAFGMFELTKLGVIGLIAGFTYIFFFGRHLLPERASVDEPGESEERQFLTEFTVKEESSFVGKTVEESLLEKIDEIEVRRIWRDNESLSKPPEKVEIEAGDRFLVSVPVSAFPKLRKEKGIDLTTEEGQVQQSEDVDEDGSEWKMAEGVIGARSGLTGKSLAEIISRSKEGQPVQILALHRHAERQPVKDFRSLKLRFGDTLLMEGPKENIRELRARWEFVSLNEPPAPDLRPEKMPFALVAIIAFVVAAGFQILPIPGLALAAAIAMVVLGCVKAREAYEAVEWNILFLIFGMLALGLALDETGGARLLVNAVLAVVGDYSPVLILAAIYIMSTFMTEMVTNNAVAALLTPLVIDIAETLTVSPRPFLVAVMFGCSASFATPIGYQTNTYVYGAGGYSFIDFLRAGLPLNLILWIIATLLIPVFWPF